MLIQYNNASCDTMLIQYMHHVILYANTIQYNASCHVIPFLNQVINSPIFKAFYFFSKTSDSSDEEFIKTGHQVGLGRVHPKQNNPTTTTRSIDIK